ncbi:MAG: hypothetical protein E7592_04095 [Ruminococcaceae bacterium]|nr:hypothetical protein [Oscillospiraceae bacterium]
MKSYIISIICVGVIGSIISLIAPEGEGGGLGKHVRLTVGCVLILMCVSPLGELIEGLRELDFSGLVPEVNDGAIEEYESIFGNSYEAAELSSLKEGIAAMLEERYGVAREDCKVEVIADRNGSGELELKRIFITLYGSAIWKDTGEIERYFGGIFDCEIVTAVG